MILKARLTFSRPGIHHVVTGKEVDIIDLTVGDVSMRIPEVEAYLSRLTGLVVKITTEQA